MLNPTFFKQKKSEAGGGEINTTRINIRNAKDIKNVKNKNLPQKLKCNLISMNETWPCKGNECLHFPPKKAQKHFENQSTYPETFFTCTYDVSLKTYS